VVNSRDISQLDRSRLKSLLSRRASSASARSSAQQIRNRADVWEPLAHPSGASDQIRRRDLRDQDVGRGFCGAARRGGPGQLDVLKQVGLDQLIHHPFMLFPCFYLVKETIEKPDAGAAAIWSEGRRKQLQNMREDCIVCWTTWIPAFLVNFSVMPMWGRVPFVAAVSFGFTTYFSFLRGGPSDDAG
jgi:hypothetical protein